MLRCVFAALALLAVAADVEGGCGRGGRGRGRLFSRRGGPCGSATASHSASGCASCDAAALAFPAAAAATGQPGATFLPRAALTTAAAGTWTGGRFSLAQGRGSAAAGPQFGTGSLLLYATPVRTGATVVKVSDATVVATITPANIWLTSPAGPNYPAEYLYTYRQSAAVAAGDVLLLSVDGAPKATFGPVYTSTITYFGGTFTFWSVPLYGQAVP